MSAETTVRSHLHEMWSAVAPAWAEHAEYADARGAEVAERLLAQTAPRPGERILELACGPGGLGLLAAERIGPGGQVVLSDVSPEMTAIAAARADARGLLNTMTRELDLDRIDEPDEAYDVVLCREGLMFASDPARAARELRRVLRPGGRVGVAVWGERARNPWLGVVFDAVGAQTGRPVPPPGAPGPFSLGDTDRMTRLLADAGFDDVVVGELLVPLRAPSFEAWWRRTSALAGPLTKVLAGFSDEARRSLRAVLQEAVGPFATPAGLELPGVALLASARRPAPVR